MRLLFITRCKTGPYEKGLGGPVKIVGYSAR